MLVWWLAGSYIIPFIELNNVIYAKSDHFINFCQIICDADTGACDMLTQNVIEVTGKKNLNNRAELLKPVHLTYKLTG